jgi:hypothetical protein
MAINSFPPSGDGPIQIPDQLIDPVSKFRVSNPENLIDTDFEYGLQPTKWETVELINNTPSFFSKSGDTTIDGISSIITNAGTREIIVKTELDHGLAVGIPINVTGTKSITADGAYIINSIPDTKTFTYLCKDNQTDTNSILDLYSSIITGEFFQGSQLRISDSDGILTDAEGTSILTVTTNTTHGFGENTPFYFLNLNSTVAQEFQAANTASKSFDASNSATAQTFDGSNSLSSVNIDWSNSATFGGTPSTISGTDQAADTITVTHQAGENFNNLPLGTPLYYSVSATGGYFNTNPRGVVFLKTINTLGTSTSTFQVSLVPDGDAIDLTSNLTGTFQIANQARTFAGNNIDPLTQTVINIEVGPSFNFDGGNQGYTGAVQDTPPNNTLTVLSYTGTEINADGASSADYYVGAMVRYTTTGDAAAGLTTNTTYFLTSFTNNSGGNYTFSVAALPGQAAISVSGGTGTQTFSRIGVSLDKDIVHIPSSNFSEGDMIEYTFPVDGRFDVSDPEEEKLFYFVDTAYDAHNYKLGEDVGFRPITATGGTILPEVYDRGRTWKVHVFTTPGTSSFVVEDAGKEGLVEYLVIGGGGGGGGGDGGSGGGGGGAGGYRSSVFGEFTGGGGVAESALTVTAQSYTVTVGAGGLGRVGSTGWTNGGNSVFGPITAVGGGRGGHQANYAGSSGGSGGGGGGGGGGGVEANTGAAPTSGQGFAGGNGGHVGGTALGGGGGGGAGSAGIAWNTITAGNGGDGLVSRITGINVTRAAGGGGSQNTNTGNRIPGLGGIGGGGNGGYTFVAQSGAANTGSGGGGGSHPNGAPLGSGANGGTGIVVVRYPITPVAPVSPTATGGTLGSVTVGDTTYRTHTFTTTGTSTFTVTNPGNLGPFDVLIVAGGGSGGVDNGGGAGGGGVIQTSIVPSATSYNIVVGAGAAARQGFQDDGPGSGGQNSSAFGLTALGGAGSTGWVNGTVPASVNNTGINGGSGSGQSSSNSSPNPQGPGLGLQPTSASGGFGNRGGFSIGSWGAGGGGARGYGSHSVGGTAVAGGLGYLPTVNFGSGLGVNGRFGAGGSGGFDFATGARASQAFSNNGVAKQTSMTGELPTPANTGGGGHGANHDNQTSGAGGSGIVIIRYPFLIQDLGE